MKTQFSTWTLALALMYYGNHYTLNAQIVTGKHKIQTGTEYFDFSQGIVVSPEDSTFDIVFVIFDIYEFMTFRVVKLKL